ncbi:uncharacterized protein BP5553_00140 [Venustampulla echinocandica]|uniref:Phosphoglycerate mutase-like protein n=1 Tax=Venustampulla echinocandica TaxID=2656787 RepID=A0A370TXA4_9HELO|nr:uncharacterized protein BP5553_00140 [Venustampulla echinocandica]RDL40161.1 hypothetical protein BP5553_00140 [Venustampulla echinocandica]
MARQWIMSHGNNSALTNHGVLQANYLGAHLAATDVKISHIFSSDLQRAVKTAEAIRAAQSPLLGEIKKLQLLREQDFGSYEGKAFSQRPPRTNKSGNHRDLESHHYDPGFKDVESKQSMIIRMNSFIDAYLLPISEEGPAEQLTVVIVAHGNILSYLWRGILKRFNARDVTVASGVIVTGSTLSLEYLGSWSNTGYLELEWKSGNSTAQHSGIFPKEGTVATDTNPSTPTKTSAQSKSSSPSLAQQVPPPLQDRPIIPASVLALPPRLLHMSLVVKAVNSQEHLKGLKKAGGGIGSLKHDLSQKTVDSFFKKQRSE